jgi:hypothetical protein
MKFVRVSAGWYESEDKKYTISKYRGIWECYLEGKREDRKYLGYKNSLADAKKLIEEIEK